MIRWIHTCVLLSVTVGLFAQQSNSWINYNQYYYEVRVAKDGLVRLDYNALVNAGIAVSSLDPRNIQVFGRGSEVSIYVKGEGDASFDPGDYVEFYAKANDGWLDGTLYAATDDPNPYYSEISDSSSYYLTWNNSTSNSRLTLETDTSFSAYVTSPYFWKKTVAAYNNEYHYGATNSIGGTETPYDATEGWLDKKFGKGGSRLHNLTTPNAYTSGPSAKLYGAVTGQSDYALMQNDHHLQVLVGTTIYVDTIYGGYQQVKFSRNIPATLIGSSTSVTARSINDLAPSDPNFVDFNAVGFYELTYPRTTNLGAQKTEWLEIDDHSTQSKTYLSFTNFNGGGSPVMYDISNRKRLPVVKNGSSYNVLIPNGGARKKCFLTDSTSISYKSLSPVFGTGKFVNYSVSAPDSAYIIVTHPSLVTDASVYATYRNTTGYNAMVVDILQLYDQYAYGVNKHPLAIKNFIKDAIANWNTPPHFLFLVGKSVKAPLRRKSTAADALDLVPTYGDPPSDIMLTAGLAGTLLEPAVPTGRLGATTGTEVSQYLTKVMDYESATRDLWMKDILHFAGGTNSTESAAFLNYLGTYESFLTDTSFGGNVTTFQKTSTAPIQITLSDSIKNMIGRGASLMTFFGHASATGGFDQNIDDPSEWGNYRKYPLVVGNACFAGDIHLDNKLSTSEKFVLINNEGAIGFMSSVGLGVPPYVHAYAAEFFRRLSGERYGVEVGKIMLETIVGVQGTGSDPLMRSTCRETTFHGDPAIKVNPASAPDFEINNQSVFYNPGDVTTQIDSFDLSLIITNYGKAVGDSIAVEIVRDFPGNQFADTVVIDVVKAVKYRDTLIFRFPVDPLRGVGINNFRITVDALNNVYELSEINNNIVSTLLIRSGDIVPVYPYEYAIVPEQNITLKASTGLPFLQSQKYIFELDTNDSFNSPFKLQYSTTKNGAVVNWAAPSLQNMPDSQVYFWRVSPDSTISTGYSWKESSFQYIAGRKGWGQSHFHQFKNDGFTYVDYNKPTRRFEFVNTVQKLKCRTYGNPIIAELWDVLYSIDNSVEAYGGIGWGSGVHIAVLDSATLEPWNSGAYDFGQLNEDSLGNKLGIFIFKTGSTAQMNAMANMLNDSVPSGNYVLAYTWRIGGFSNWPTATMNAMLSLGADTIQYINDSIPYIFLCKKGDVNTAIEVIGDSIRSKIDLDINLSKSSDFGFVKSEVLGPATSWDSLFWRSFHLETPSYDSLSLNVYGVNMGGKETLLRSDIPVDSMDLSIAASVNANNYPFLRLESFLQDDSLKTAPQLSRWQVVYDEAPECAINPDIHFSFHADTVMQGENVRLELAVENIGKYDMDSLLISYSVLTEDNKLISLNYPRQKPLKKDSVLISVLDVSTGALEGACKLLIDVNPNNDQLEQYHFNNIGELEFYVVADDANPILDVTFDGAHILDGEIVSAKPTILIQLTDENEYLALNDTSDFEIYLTNPAGQERRIYFKDQTGQDVLNFTPAQLPKNSCKIEWDPTFGTDGVYKLEVRASDRSQNESGDYGYEISFEVINRSTITNVVNYPNPFSTCTHFVFTLTGSEVPDNFQIQIMTITGKLVKTITKEDLGPLRVGNNRTPYCWNGTDDYGDQLANGLYLYRVNTRLNNEPIEHRTSSADKFFRKGFGKMYLLR